MLVISLKTETLESSKGKERSVQTRQINYSQWAKKSTRHLILLIKFYSNTASPIRLSPVYGGGRV